MEISTSSSYSITMRLEIEDKAGNFAKIASAIGTLGGSLGAVDLVSVAKGHKTRDVTVDCRNEGHAKEILGAVKALDGVRLVSWSDRVFLMPQWIGLADEQACRSCHLDLNYCVDCHFRRDSMARRVHGLGYRLSHGLEARLDAAGCGRCHNASYCFDCHRESGP